VLIAWPFLRQWHMCHKSWVFKIIGFSILCHYIESRGRWNFCFCLIISIFLRLSKIPLSNLLGLAWQFASLSSQSLEPQNQNVIVLINYL
jgi:hypothetical protein